MGVPLGSLRLLAVMDSKSLFFYWRLCYASLIRVKGLCLRLLIDSMVATKCKLQA